MLSKKQEQKREDKISTLKKAIMEHPEASDKELEMDMAGQLGCCIKTAKEYIKIARWRIENDFG